MCTRCKTVVNLEQLETRIMGKPQIYFANMGHGEAIAFEINGQWYLRDFGESNSKRVADTQCNINKIYAQNCPNCPISDFISASPKWDVIVSHSHKDHVCGFEKLFEDKKSKIFRNAFIPSQYSLGDCADKTCFLQYIEANLHIYCFAKTYKYRKSAEFFLTMPIIMDYLAEQTHYLYIGCSDTSFPGTVFAPGKNLVQDDGRNGYNINNALKNYYAKYNNENINDFRNTAEEIFQILSPYLIQYDIHINKDNQNDCKKICEKIEKLKKRHAKTSFDVRLLQRDVKGSIDDRSLVFDIFFQYEDAVNVLFLGDNSDASINRISVNFKEYYDYIKASHHGSRGGRALKKIYSAGSKTKTTICCCGLGHRSGEVNSEYYDISQKVLWTEKKDYWNDPLQCDLKKCKIEPQDLN